MSWWHTNKLEAKIPALDIRRRMMMAVRTFFEAEGFWEVETPALQVMPCADKHIHGFQTEYFGPDLKKRGDFYLHTSPEFAMKKLLVAGLPKIYQICHVFRNGEQTRLHSPEFTLLEWYRAQDTYQDIMNDCNALLKFIQNKLEINSLSYKGHDVPLGGACARLSVAQAFDVYAAIDLNEFLENKGDFSKKIQSLGIRVADDDAWDDLFFRVMAAKIEPHLGMNAPTILYDYPASMAALSRKKPDDQRYAERFELYVAGVELANAFTELTDPAEQRVRFEKEMNEKKALHGFSYPIDEDFLAALEYGLPPCAGIALGLDRLAMLLVGAENIEQVLWTENFL
jgi:lysyl-tRNA synthetase class 2